MKKQTAGRDQLGTFAPKFAQLMMMCCLGKCGAARNSFLYAIVPWLPLCA